MFERLKMKLKDRKEDILIGVAAGSAVALVIVNAYNVTTKTKPTELTADDIYEGLASGQTLIFANDEETYVARAKKVEV